MKSQLIRIIFGYILMLIPLAGAFAAPTVQAQQKPAETARPPVADATHAQ